MPEEINRLLTDQISDYLFTHSRDADENLKREGIPQEKIFFVGNVMIDSLLYNKPFAEKSDILERLGLLTAGSDEPSEPNEVKELVVPYALMTLHRPSNVDEKHSLTNIMSAITKISEWIPVVFPAHPRTQKRLREFDLNLPATVTASPDELNKLNKRMLIVPPLSYLDFLKLEIYAKFVMTDSGGIQEETTVLNVPCLTLRDTTERPITITRGTNVLVGNSPQKIIEEASKILASKSESRPNEPNKLPPLWDGRTAERIVEILASRSYNL